MDAVLIDKLASDTAHISAAIDGSYPETVTREERMWRRYVKVATEAGELLQAIEAALGENPRKGVTGTWAEVEKEMLDVAAAALGAYEAAHDNDGSSAVALVQHMAWVRRRLDAAMAKTRLDDAMKRYREGMADIARTLPRNLNTLEVKL